MMRTSCSLIGSRDVEHDDGDLGLLERGRGAQRRVEVGALLQVHAATDAGGVDEAPHLAAELDLLVDRVAGGAGELVDDDALLPRRLVQQARLADVRAAEDRDAARSADLLLRDGRDLGQHLQDGVEQVGDAAAVQRRDGVRLAEAEGPERGGARLLARVVDLVGDEEHRLAALAQHLHDVLVGRGRADDRVDDEQHGVGEVDRRPRPAAATEASMPWASGSQPPVSTSVKRRSFHSALVRDAVARDAGGVLDDGLAAAEDAVDERGLADVRAADDRQHRQRRQVPDLVGVLADVLEEVEVLVVEVVVLEADRAGWPRGSAAASSSRAARRSARSSSEVS